MLPSLVEQLVSDTAGQSLPLCWPEVLLVATMVASLASRVAPGLRRLDPYWVAAAGLVAALGALVAECSGGLAGVARQELFTGMLVHDALGVYGRGLLLVATLLVVVLSKLTGLASRDDSQDLFVLLLGAALGMCLMCRANHLMSVVLAIEMASVPSYVLVGVVKGRRRSSEAALKYSVYGAAAAGVMLFGVSLVVGVFGSAHLPTIGDRLAAMDLAAVGADPAERGVLIALTLGVLLVLVGFAFKLSAAPLHFWAPDVLAGAPAEVGAFLSVASKTAALVLLLRVLATTLPGDPLSGAAPAAAFVSLLLAVIAGASCVVGNLAALGQSGAKRMLAYSTIAHAGYLLMPLAAAAALAPRDPAAACDAAAGAIFYAGGYLFLNATAFAVVAVIRNERASESLEDYAGLGRTAPVTAAALSLSMIGLLGLPPLVGFFGKLAALRPLVEAGGPAMLTLLGVALAGTAVSAVYYLRVVKTVWLDSPPIDSPTTRPPLPLKALLVVLAAPIVLLGLIPEALASAARDACVGLFGW